MEVSKPIFKPVYEKRMPKFSLLNMDVFGHGEAMKALIILNNLHTEIFRQFFLRTRYNNQETGALLLITD